MVVVKFALAGLLAAGLAVMWQHRVEVVDAYRTDHQPIDLALGGVDLTAGIGDAGPSPYVVRSAPDTRLVAPGPAVSPAPPAPVELTGGSTTLSGTVLGPDGPHPGAIVRIERHTTIGAAAVELVTDEEGRWEATELLGGRFRIRAYVPELLTSAKSTVAVLAAGEGRIVDQTIGPASEAPVIGFVTPEKLTVGYDATVAVTVARRVVDAEGRVVQQPESGRALGLAAGLGVVVRSADVVASDAGGAARFLVQCQEPGQFAMWATVDGQGRSVMLPPCEPEEIPDENGEEGTDQPEGDDR